MNSDIAVKLDGFGGACFCVEDDPYGGIRHHEPVCGFFIAHSLDEFWLRIRNR